MKWRVISASVIGTSHERAGQTCQDFNCCRLITSPNQDCVLVLVASDGAGSAAKGGDGAQLACELWCSEVEALVQAGGTLHEISRAFMSQWVDRYVLEVTVRATEDGLQPRDYACTFLTAVVSEDISVFAQVGDGAIVTEDLDHADEYCWVFWPQKGEYENQTHFLTDRDAPLVLEHCVERPVCEVSLFTDGLQRLALHYGTQSVFAPFFRSIVGRVRTSMGSGYLVDLSKQLEHLLASEHINNRTDDDKTLMVATRRTVPEKVQGEESA